MNITASPATDGMYFSLNIPDFVVEKNGSNTSVAFSLSHGATNILNEKYSYDAAGKINITQLGEVINAEMDEIGKIVQFTWSIVEGNTTVSHSFTAIKCDADMVVDAASWTAKNFLTRAYRQKRTAIERKEYLSFIQKQSYGEVSCHLELFYISNSGILTSYSEAFQSIEQSSATVVATFESSLSKMVAAAALTTEKIVYYNVWLTGTSFATEKYTYLVDRTPYRNQLHLMFTNCFGAIDTFTATGGSDAQRKNEQTLANIGNRLKKISQTLSVEHSLNSGFVSEAEMLWLDDLLHSYSVAIYEADIVIDNITLTDSDKTDSTANELHNFSIKYRRENNIHLQFEYAMRGVFDTKFDSKFN